MSYKSAKEMAREVEKALGDWPKCKIRSYVGVTIGFSMKPKECGKWSVWRLVGPYGDNETRCTQCARFLMNPEYQFVHLESGEIVTMGDPRTLVRRLQAANVRARRRRARRESDS